MATRQLVVLTLGTEEHALPIEQVQEVIRFTPPRAIAAADPWIKGIIAVRGTLISVLDLATRLGSDTEPGERRKIVIADTGTEKVGIVVDGVAEVLTVDDTAFLPVPIAGDHVVEAMVVVGDRLIAVLSLDRLLGREPRVP